MFRIEIPQQFKFANSLSFSLYNNNKQNYTLEIIKKASVCNGNAKHTTTMELGEQV